MAILNAGLPEVDKDLIKYLFKLKAMSLEYAETVVGTYSVAKKITDTAFKLIDYIDDFSKKDAFFYIFLGDEIEENLKLVCSSVTEKSDKTRYYAITIHQNWLDFSVKQLSLGGKMLAKIK